MRLHIFCTLFLLSATTALTQTKKDSLYNLLVKTKTDTSRIDLLIQLGNVFEDINYDSSIVQFQKALALSENLEDQRRISKSYYSMAGMYMRKGSYDKSNKAYEKSIEIDKKIGDNSGVAGALSTMGVNYMYLGQLEKATECLEESIALSKKDKNVNMPKMAYHNLGLVYMNLGLFDRSSAYLDTAIEYYKSIEDIDAIGNAYNDKGIIAYYKALYNESLVWYQKSLEYHLKANNKWGASNNYMNIGIINVFQTRSDTNTIEDKIRFYSSAVNNFQKCQKLKEELNDLGGVALNDVNISALYFDMAKLHDQNETTFLDSAIQISKRAIKRNFEIRAIPNVKISHFTLSKAYWAKGEFEKAKDAASKLILMQKQDLQNNFSFISEQEKELYFEKNGEDFQYFNSLALALKEDFPEITIDVFNNSIQNKGMLLKSSTAMKNTILSSKDEGLIQEYEQWIKTKQLIAEQYAIMKEKRSFDLDSLEQLANQQERSLVKKSSDFASFTGAQKLDFKQIKAQLQKDEAAVEFIKFYIYDGQDTYEYLDSILYCALVITPESAAPKMIPLFGENTLIQALGGKTNSNSIESISKVYGKKGELNNNLYQLIWKPIEGEVKEYKKLIISPVGYLHKLSFAAIAMDKKIYLSDVHDIEVLTNTGQLAYSGKTEKTIEKFTLFGGIQYNQTSQDEVWTYLKGTEEETSSIKSILEKGKKEVNLFSKLNASEKQFKEIAAKSDVLHVATHGFFYPNPEDVVAEIEKGTFTGDVTFRGDKRGFGTKKFVKNPNPLMRSGIVFAKANDVWSEEKNNSDNDGVLTAQEVAHIDLRNTSLVVLSACETALGDIKGSEGVYGLQRAFKMAGADQLIMSLWKVPDKETAEFMTFFYSQLTKGNTISESFTKTQKEFSKKYDPYFWAAFVLLR